MRETAYDVYHMAYKMKKDTPGSSGCRGLAVFDVDGVLFRKVFLIQIARYTGIKNYLKTLFLGWRYYMSSVSFETLLEGGLRLIKNFDALKAQEIAHKMKKSENIQKTVEILHAEGYFIFLLSSGIPNFILKTLSEEIGADHYSGLDVNVENGRIKADEIVIRPKEIVVHELLHKLGLTWENVVTIADDPNNLTIIKNSNPGIGYNPSKIIRKHADIVVDGYNLLELIPYIIPENKLPKNLSKDQYSLKREVYRKIIHFLGVPIPFLAYLNRNLICVILFTVIVLYAFSETLRYIGFHFPVVSHITKKAQRYTEIRGFIVGPISLTLGILIPLLFFPYTIYIPSILIVCISDSISSLVGKKFGKLTLPLYQRTVEGSAAFFLSALLILSFFLPFRLALLTALLPTAIELFSPFDLDNLLVPVGTALFLKYVVL